jgi:DNA-directed RNA polymerase subunit N (RpoN/RPB10)
MRCMNCGFVLSDKWRWYQEKLKQLKAQKGLKDTPLILDGSPLPDKTPERELMDMLGMSRQCCRKHFLTHRDLMDKI